MKDLEKLCDEDYEALANLRYRIRRFRQFSAKEARKLSLTSQQHQALLAIRGLPARKRMTSRMLAQRLLMDRKAVDDLILELLDQAYVEVGHPTADGRRQSICLTPKAVEVLDRLASAHLLEIREMAPELMQALRALQDRQNMQRIAWML